MKKIVFLFIGWLLFTLSSYSEEKGLVLYYSFDNVKNNTIEDLSGNGNNLCSDKGFVLTEGVKGKGLLFDGKTVYSIPDKDCFSFKNGLTISMWIKMDMESVRWVAFIKKAEGVEKTPKGWKRNPTAYVPFKGFNLGTYGSSRPIPLNEAPFRFTVGDEENRETLLTKPISRFTSPGKWFYICATYNPDPKDRGMRIYINGKIVKEKIMISMPEDITNNAPLILGKDLTFFKGGMDELKIYNRVLTEKEVKELFKSYKEGKK